tara:strand:- start:2088 stop:2264 length:177 start_codon:yes stop_codon:yes gene_type:complete
MDLKKINKYTLSSSIKRITAIDNNASGKIINTLDLKVLDIDETYWTPQSKKKNNKNKK